MLSRFTTPLLALLALATTATAQTVSECDWRASAANLVEPWQDNSRTFSKGAVRLALLDTVEPAAAAFHLLVLSPPYDEVGARQCRVISGEGGTGFNFIDMKDLRSAYDPARGLTFDIPAGVFLSDGNTVVRGLIVTLNQATGGIDTRLATDRVIGD